MSTGVRAAGGALLGAALALTVPLVAKWEGKRNDPYYDIVGVRTVCYGETRVPMRRYSDAECTAMLEEAVKEYRDRVVACTPTLKDRPYQLAAATSLAYNVGIGAYCRSTASRLFNQQDWEGGCRALTRFNKAGGRVVRGLVNRRNEEYKLCSTNLD